MSYVIYATRMRNAHLAKGGYIRFGQEFEERVVQLLVVDIDLAHIGLNTLACLCLEHRVCLLFNTMLASEIGVLRAPVSGNRDGVAVTLVQWGAG